MATNFVAKFANLATPPLFGVRAFQNGLPDRNFDYRALNGNDFSTFCRNLVRFGPAIWEFTTLECAQQVSMVLV